MAIKLSKAGFCMYYCCGITDTGSVRDHNEDAFLINKLVLSQASLESNIKAPFIVAVADGVGGEASGEIASHLCLEQLASVKFTKPEELKKKVKNIHRNLRRYGVNHDRSVNMQTTLCALAVDDKKNAYIINVGDSRLYRFRGDTITQLSTDQSLVQLLYEQGKITREEKRFHAQRNIIFPVMGNLSDDPKIDVTPIEGGIREGDLIIICSDGLSDYLSANEFETVLSRPVKLTKRLSQLIDTALKNGSSDNLTVVALTVCEV